MTNEIKEILDYFRKYSTIRENTMITDIEDYITNLQEENEYNNFCNEKLREKITNLEYKISTYENIEQQIDKAIEYIENDIDLTGINGFEKLLNILRGDE